MSENTSVKRTIQGKVVKKAGDKSITVLVERRVVHAKYHKFVRKFKKYIVHDEANSVHVGDLVEAEECKPISKRKAFVLKRVVQAGVE